MAENKITDSMIEEYIVKFEKGYGDNDKAITSLFNKYKLNNDFELVFAKVCVINYLYNAGVPDNQVSKKAEHICQINTLDDDLEKGNLKAYEDISNAVNGLNHYYVFASKYCHFHNPDKFPIFDQYSRFTLCELYKQTDFSEKVIDEEDLKDYTLYKKCLDEFLESKNNKWNYKQIDEFLWMYGVEHKNKK